MTSTTTTPTNAQLRNPFLQQMLIDGEQITTAMQALFAELAPQQLTWKPNPQEWSIVECVDHLVVTGGLYYPRVRAATERARATGKTDSRPFRPSLFAKWFIGLASPNTTTKVKTIRIFEPSSSANTSICATFLEQQQELVALIRQADGVDLNTVKFGSPATRLLRFSIGEAVLLLVRHQQLHLQQAQQVCTIDGFPREHL